MNTFFIPPIKDMVQRTRNAFRAEMPGTDAWIWPNNIYVSAKVIGGAVWEIFGRLKWMDRQRFALTASGYELERHGLDYGIGRKPASYAQGNVIVVAETYPVVITSGTSFTRSDGLTFTSTQAKSVGKYDLTAIVPVVCDQAGKTGNTVYGTPLTLSLAGTSGAAVDDVGLGQGADQETDDQLRARILHRKRYPPHGGSLADYVGWATELPGVTRAFVKGNAYGRGTVVVWFLMDDTYPAGIPQSMDVAAVQAHLETVAPITANIVVLAPIADCIDIIVKSLSPDTQAVRESVAAELRSLFRNSASPSLPGDLFTLYDSQIWQAISNASGEQHHELVQPASPIEFPVGVMPCLKSVSFIP